MDCGQEEPYRIRDGVRAEARRAIDARDDDADDEVRSRGEALVDGRQCNSPLGRASAARGSEGESDALAQHSVLEVRPGTDLGVRNVPSFELDDCSEFNCWIGRDAGTAEHCCRHLHPELR